MKAPEDSGSIIFVQHHVPPLPAGTYQVKVSHEVASQQEQQPFAQTYSYGMPFTVEGPRFALGSGDVHSVHPPTNSEGEFTHTLPHIVLTQPTLPWQRQVGKDAAPTASWLALLLFDEGEPVPPRQEQPLKALAQPPAGVLHPPVQLEPGTQEQRCFVIDVPVELFQAIVPSAADLPFVAHARTVALADKAMRLVRPALTSDEPAKKPSHKDYAVVISHRLPGAGMAAEGQPAPALRHTVHLVSLEGFGPLLSGPAETFVPPPDCTHVRVVSLWSWSFTVQQKPHTLTEVLTRLDCSPSHLQVPFPSTATDEQTAWVRGALAAGFIPLNHHTREDDATVSWYRGPLVPYAIPPTPVTPLEHADGGLRYDPGSGMFDVSLAAAWNLGRLLALQSPGFVRALNGWRRGKEARSRGRLRRERLQRVLGVPPPLRTPSATDEAAPLLQEVPDLLARGLAQAAATLSRSGKDES